MSKQISTNIRINATPEAIWKVLTDFEKYPEWNPFIKSVTGDVKEGNTIKIELQGMVFKPVVLSLIENKELKWLGHFWLKGLFDGEHRFYLSENKDGSTNLEQSEKFSGILVRVLSKSLDEKTKKGFEKMNEELKRRVERIELSR